MHNENCILLTWNVELHPSMHYTRPLSHFVTHTAFEHRSGSVSQNASTEKEEKRYKIQMSFLLKKGMFIQNKVSLLMMDLNGLLTEPCKNHQNCNHQ